MKTLYIDMDNVIVDFTSAFPKIDEQVLEKYANDKDEIPGIFSLMQPMPKAIEAVEFLANHFDVYILSTAPWENPSAWSDKLLWIKKYLPKVAWKKLILSHNKNLNLGDYLIDDRTANGAGKFTGNHIHFGQEGLETWGDILVYLCKEENIEIPPKLIYDHEQIPLKKELKGNIEEVINNTIKTLHAELFSEEFDFMCDSNVEAKERRMYNKNPMSEAYTNKIHNKRRAMGVSPLTANGYAPDSSSLEYCEKIVFKFIEQLFEKRKIESLKGIA